MSTLLQSPLARPFAGSFVKRVTYPADGLSIPLTWGVSLAKLRSDYAGPAVKLRRASDDALADVGFATTGNVNPVVIAAHMGTSTLSCDTWYDQCASANAIQAIKSKQPDVMLDAFNGQYYLKGDGLSKAMETSQAVNCSGQTAVTVVLGLKTAGGASDYSVLIESNGVGGGDNWNCSANFGSVRSFGAQLQSGGGNYMQNRGQTIPQVPKNYVVVFTFRPGAGDSDTKASVRVNGVDEDETLHLTNGTVTNAAFINAKLNIFARTQDSFFTRMAMHTAMVFNGELTGEDRAQIENWLGGKLITYVDEPTDYDDSRTLYMQDVVPSASPYANATYSTTATRLGVQTHVNYVTDAGKVFSVYVNGAFFAEVPTSQSAGFAKTILTLPPGAKQVTVVGGPANWPGSGPIQGVNIQHIEANAPLTRVVKPDTNRVTILGDSIAVGASASVISRDGWAMRLRLLNAMPISVEGYGFRALYDEAGSPQAIIDSVARTVEHAPSKLIIELGINDYHRNTFSPSVFATQYATLLEAIHAALPAMPIYCQTPIIHLNEGVPNGAGGTPADYRAAIATAAAGKSYVTLLNGFPILTVDDLVDGVHPAAAGHAKIFNFYRSVLGV